MFFDLFRYTQNEHTIRFGKLRNVIIAHLVESEIEDQGVRINLHKSGGIPRLFTNHSSKALRSVDQCWSDGAVVVTPVRTR